LHAYFNFLFYYMNELNLISILYLSFRFAPLLIVGFFVFSSVINMDFKAVIYLAGLLLASLFTSIIGNSLPLSWIVTDGKNLNNVCNIIKLSNNGAYSKIPLSQTVFGYTFFYLYYIIYKNYLLYQNLPLLILFPILILSDFYWNIVKNCSSYKGTAVALLTGAAIGNFWAWLIDYYKIAKLQYFSGINNQNYCNRPARQTFKCNFYQNGKQVTTFNPVNAS